MNDESPIRFLFLKFGSALAVLATMDFWTTLGKMCAAAYSIAIFSEWVWKKALKPLIAKLVKTESGDVSP